MGKTLDEIAVDLIAAGGVEYHSSTDGEGTRAFEFKASGGVHCECNDKPPSLHVILWRGANVYGIVIKPGAEFRIAGQAGGKWLRAILYGGIPLDMAVAELPKARSILANVWAAFCAASVSAEVGHG